MKEDRSFPTPFTTASELNDAVREIKNLWGFLLKPSGSGSSNFHQVRNPGGWTPPKGKVAEWSVSRSEIHTTQLMKRKNLQTCCVQYKEQRLNYCETGSCGTLWGKLVFCVCAWGGVYVEWCPCRVSLGGQRPTPEVFFNTFPQYFSGRVSLWTWALLFQLADRLVSELQYPPASSPCTAGVDMTGLDDPNSTEPSLQLPTFWSFL